MRIVAKRYMSDMVEYKEVLVFTNLQHWLITNSNSVVESIVLDGKYIFLVYIKLSNILFSLFFILGIAFNCSSV